LSQMTGAILDHLLLEGTSVSWVKTPKMSKADLAADKLKLSTAGAKKVAGAVLKKLKASQLRCTPPKPPESPEPVHAKSEQQDFQQSAISGLDLLFRAFRAGRENASHNPSPGTPPVPKLLQLCNQSKRSQSPNPNL